MTVRRLFYARLAMIVVALIVTIWALWASRSFAQRDDPELRRVDRRLEKIDSAQQDLRIEAEKRWGEITGDLKTVKQEISSLKEELSVVRNVGLALFSAMLLMIAQGGLAWYSDRKKRKGDE